MAIALIDSVGTAGGSGGGTTGDIDTTGANLIVGGWAYYAGASTLAFTDSKSCSWNPLTLSDFSSVDNVFRLIWTTPSSVGSGHNFSSSGSNVFGGLGVIAVSGAHASPFDQESVSPQGVSVAEGTPGEVTPTEDNELIVVGMSINNNADFATAVAIDSGFTILYAFNSGATYAHMLAYKIQTSAAPEEPLLTWTASSAGRLSIATFKAAGGGGGNNIVRHMLQHHHRQPKPKHGAYRRHESGLYLRAA